MRHSFVLAGALAFGVTIPAVAQLSGGRTGGLDLKATSVKTSGLVAGSSNIKITNNTPAVSSNGTAFRLTILHSSDGESQLINAGSGLEDFGGVARFATVVANLKADASQDPNEGFVLISSGDNFLPGPELNASLTNGVPYFDSLALDQIGYDAITIGNHEFDLGPDVLQDFIDSFTNPPAFLSANLDFTNEPGLLGKIVSSTVVSVAGNQVGIIGATTENLSFISSPRDTVIDAVLPAVQAEIAALTNNGVDVIILSSHLQGIDEEVALLSQVDGIDAVIAGGGGDLLANAGALLIPGDTSDGAYPRLEPDLSGDLIPVVSTDGDYKYVGRLILEIDAAGVVTAIDPASDPVRVAGGNEPDAVVADATVQSQVVDPVAAFVDALAQNIIGFSEVFIDGVRENIRFGETNAGNLIADSFLWTAIELADEFGTGTPDVALANGGGIRAPIAQGNISELDTFSILPFTNFITTIEGISPQQFKEIMENAVSRVLPEDGGSGTGRWAQIAGFRMTWDPAGVAQQLDDDDNVTQVGSRVTEIVLNDGRVIVRDGVVNPDAAPINVVTVNFLATGGDQYPFRGAPFTLLGVTYQQALFNYIVDFLGGNVTAAEYPEGGENRIIRLP